MIYGYHINNLKYTNILSTTLSLFVVLYETRYNLHVYYLVLQTPST